MHKTIQREAILKLLRESEKHLSADEVFTILRYKVPQISLATIYRNLKQLSAAQIISEVTTINIQKKFESNMSVHFHIHCPVCGKEIRKQTIDQIIDRIMTLPEGTRFLVLSPIVRGQKGRHEKVLGRPVLFAISAAV